MKGSFESRITMDDFLLPASLKEVVATFLNNLDFSTKGRSC